jgi:formyltetrahydrofolate-dependent phosphoribosylglycinamide formyltransferase
VARLAVLASGNGSNFEALATALGARPAAEGPRHECVLLVYDRRAALAAERAARLGVPSRYVGYAGRSREEAEAEIDSALVDAGSELVALAGFMRILTPIFARRWKGRILNIHPSLLPKWPGAHAIKDAYESGERRFGATVHYIDEDVDTGPIVAQESFLAAEGEPIDSIEGKTHAIEHALYPRVALEALDGIERARRRR